MPIVPLLESRLWIFRQRQFLDFCNMLIFYFVRCSWFFLFSDWFAKNSAIFLTIFLGDLLWRPFLMICNDFFWQSFTYFQIRFSKLLVIEPKWRALADFGSSSLPWFFDIEDILRTSGFALFKWTIWRN